MFAADDGRVAAAGSLGATLATALACFGAELLAALFECNGWMERTGPLCGDTGQAWLVAAPAVAIVYGLVETAHAWRTADHRAWIRIAVLGAGLMAISAVTHVLSATVFG